MIIPVCAFNSKDAAQAARMLNWCADLCGQQPNTCVLAYEPGTPADAVQRAASRAFVTVEHLPVRSSSDGWPGSANDYFAITANAMRTRGPWLWMESDCVPMSPQWLAALENDFMRNEKLALGTVIPMFLERDGAYQQIGDMLCGVAVYHPKIWERSPLLRSLRQYGTAYAKSGVPPRAFDSYLANEILKVAASTPLIQHMGRSRAFRREGGQIVCTYGPESRWSPVVAPGTALVHGCKDESLIALLRAEMNLPAREHADTPASAVRVIETTRKPAAALAWGTSDALPKEKVTNGVPEVSAKPATITAPVLQSVRVRIPTSPEHAEALSTARNAIEHWPECKGHLFTLNVGKNERFRVACQCGAMSGKLPEGVDWEQVWKAQMPVDEGTSEVQDTSAASDASARLQLDGSSMAEQEAHNLQAAGSIPARPTTPSKETKVVYLKVMQICIGPNGARVRFEDGSSQDIVDEQIVRTGRNLSVKGSRKKKPKKKRTPEEQAKINLRMAKLRARKPARTEVR